MFDQHSVGTVLASAMTLIPVFQNHFQTLLQSFLQSRRAESCTTTSCWTLTMTRRAPRCDRSAPASPGSSPGGKPSDLTGKSFFWQRGTTVRSWDWCIVGTVISRIVEVGEDLSENRAQPLAKLRFHPQKKFNDLGLDNGFQTLGWKE